MMDMDDALAMASLKTTSIGPGDPGKLAMADQLETIRAAARS